MTINEEKAVEWWMESLQGQLTDEQQKALDEFLIMHPALHEELMASTSTWRELENIEIPQPGPQMEQRFKAMLEGYTAASDKNSSWRKTISGWLAINWQTSLASLCIGLIIGLFIWPKENSEVKVLSAEVSQMKKMLMLSMIEKPRAQERILAVNMTDEFSGKDERVIESLIATLNNDHSVNVRLAALDALIGYGDQEEVREALVRSIPLQHSPLLQVALADAMVLLQEKKAVEPFSNILDAENLDESVRFKLKSTIETLKEI